MTTWKTQGGDVNDMTQQYQYLEYAARWDVGCGHARDAQVFVTTQAPFFILLSHRSQDLSFAECIRLTALDPRRRPIYQHTTWYCWDLRSWRKR